MRKTWLLVPVLLWSSAFLTAAEKKRVAVLDFDFGAVQDWWGGHWDVGHGISNLIVTQLVENGTYRVIERQALDAVLAEQNFSNSQRADAATAARLGKLLGVDAIVVGTVTEFGTENKRMDVGGIAGTLGGFGRGRVGTSSGKAVVSVNARLVDVNTGEIVAVAAGKGESSRKGLLLGGAGGGGGGFGGGGIDMGSSDFRETILGEATYKAVEELAAKLIEAEAKIPEVKREIRGLVAYADADSLILNVGSSHGVKVGDQLAVLRVKQVIKDPATGNVLRELTDSVGQIRVTEVDEASSVATVISGSGFQVGDVVKKE